MTVHNCLLFCYNLHQLPNGQNLAEIAKVVTADA